MSGTRESRGWIIVLVAMVVLTAGCTVGYLAAPFETPPAERAGRSPGHTVAPEHRIAAVTEEGSLVLIDGRDGSPTETVVPDGMNEIADLELGSDRETAYISERSGPPSIGLVRLRAGEDETLGNGAAVTVGPLSYPQLDRDIERPEVDQMAFVRRRDGTDHIVIENLVTGSRTVLGPRDGSSPFRTIDDLVWSPFDNRLFGIADGGRLLFRLDADRARTLDDAVVNEAAEGTRWRDATPYGDGLAVIAESADRFEILEVERRLEPVGVILDTGTTPLRGIDADSEAAVLLATTTAGELLRVDRRGEPAVVTNGIRLAAW